MNTKLYYVWGQYKDGRTNGWVVGSYYNESLAKAIVERCNEIQDRIYEAREVINKENQ